MLAVLFQIVICLAVSMASPQLKPLLKKTAIRHCILSPINYELLIMHYNSSTLLLTKFANASPFSILFANNAKSIN